MEISFALIALGLLIFFSHIFSALFSKTRIPNVLLLMLIGLVIGPVFGLITPEDLGKFGSVFTTITLISILFESGTSLDLKVLGKSLFSGSLFTIINFIIAALIGTFVGILFLKMSVLHSVFLGAALGGTSTAVVVPMLGQLNPNPKAKIILYIESAISDILCLVVALALLSGIQTGTLKISAIFTQMGVSMLLAIVVGIIIGTIWIVVLKKYLSGIKNTMFTTFALAFILYGVCESVGLNGGMAILSFGITAGNIGNAGFIRKLFNTNEESALNQQEKNFYSEIVFILQTYFFVYIGMSIKFNNVLHLVIGAIFVLLVFLTRPISTKVIGKKDLSPRDLKLISILGPKGLVAAVLASLPLQYAQSVAQAGTLDLETTESLLKAGQAIQNVSYAVVLFSILICSIMVITSERKFASMGKQEALGSQEEQTTEDQAVSEAEAVQENTATTEENV